MSEIATEFGQRLRALRLDRKMSQEELSFKASISAAHLGQIERGLKKPTVETIGRLASALEIPMTALFSSEPYEVLPQNPTVAKINAHLVHMSEEEQRDILKLIRIFKGFRDKEN